MSSGNPARLAAASSDASDWSAGVSPGTTGTPARSISRRAEILDPIAAMAADGGPMKVIPADSQAAAKSAFSARNP